MRRIDRIGQDVTGSGLDQKRCDDVLSALMRAGLMMRLQHDAYVRCRLQAQVTEKRSA